MKIQSIENWAREEATTAACVVVVFPCRRFAEMLSINLMPKSKTKKNQFKENEDYEKRNDDTKLENAS